MSPPPIQPPIPPPAGRTNGRWVLVIVASTCIIFITAILCMYAIPALMGAFMFSLINDAADIKISTSPGTFRVQVLEMRSTPDHFVERIHVQCDGDMTLCFNAYDLTKFGLQPRIGTNGESYYQEGHPEKAGEDIPIKAKNNSSECEVLLKLDAVTNGTAWHSEVRIDSDSSKVDTSFRDPFQIKDIQTNWPGAYEKGSALPLASFGKDKIMLLVK